MTQITAQQVKRLREATNVSMMDCKRALVEADGDFDQATRLLRERGMAVAAKRAGRAAQQGLVASASSEDGVIQSLVEVNCETDFVARNESFRAFVGEVASQACETDDPLSEQMGAELTAKIAEIGENLVLRRNTRFVLRGTGAIGSYIHLGGKVGVLVEVGCEKAETVSEPAWAELVRDLTLHVAACNPAYLVSDEVPEQEIASERAIYAKQVQNKPPQILEKIVDGKMRKYFAEVCLIDQGFVKEPKTAVHALLTAVGKQLGDNLQVRRFVRYQLGE